MRNSFSNNVQTFSLPRLVNRISLSAVFFLCIAATAAVAQTPKESAPPTAPSAKSDKGVSTNDQTRARRAASTQTSADNKSSTATKSIVGKDVLRLDELREQINNAASGDERARLQRTLVDYLVALDRKTEAVAQLRVMMREDRFDPTGFYNIGNALARLDDSNTAVDAYRKAITQRHGNYSRALNNMGNVLLRLGRWDEAQQALVSALTQESFRYAEASYNLGRLYAKRGEADAAIREWTRTLKLDPNHTDATLALARAYAEDGNSQQAIAMLDSFTTRYGASAEVSNARREILLADEIETAEAKTAAGKPNAKSAAERNVARPRAAASNLRTLAVDRDTYDVLQRARRAREAGRYEDAIADYRRVLARRDNFFPPANLELSYALITLHRTDEAIASLLPLTTKAGARYPEANYHLARLYELRGELRLAGDAYEQAVAADKTNPQFLLDVSRVREKEGNMTGALAAFQAYLSRSEQTGRVPDWADARLNDLRQKAAAASSPSTTTKR